MSGNPDEIHRMILNLLENAIRHTPEGTAIDVGLAIDGDTARLTVPTTDPACRPAWRIRSSPGSSAAQGPADRSARNGAGTGLGLSIVRAVASAHGGEVTAAKGPRRGLLQRPYAARGPRFERTIRGP